MKKLHPTLMFNGHCKAALEFYKVCLDGDIVFLKTYAEAPFDIPDEYQDGVYNSGFQAGKMVSLRLGKLDSISRFKSSSEAALNQSASC